MRSRPHDILLIVLDDVPRAAHTAYGAPHRLTPHLDALSAEGVTFDHAFTTAPLCTPARWSLLTGRHAANASSIVSHRPWNLVGFNTFLNGHEPTMAHELSRAGFSTGLFGKYHLGFPMPKRFQTGRATFGGSGRGLTHADMVRAVCEHGGFEEAPALFGGNKQTAEAAHHPEWMAQQAVAFLDRAHTARRRAFVYFAPTLPHAPFTLPGSLLANASHTPAGWVAADPAWQAQRAALLASLGEQGYVCAAAADACAASSPAAEPAQPSSTRCARRPPLPLQLTDAFLDLRWLTDAANCEQRRLAYLFAAGLAWIDLSVGAVLGRLRPASLVIHTADHGASWLGKGERCTALILHRHRSGAPSGAPDGSRYRSGAPDGSRYRSGAPDCSRSMLPRGSTPMAPDGSSSVAPHPCLQIPASRTWRFDAVLTAPPAPRARRRFAVRSWHSSAACDAVAWRVGRRHALGPAHHAPRPLPDCTGRCTGRGWHEERRKRRAWHQLAARRWRRRRR